jgi:micrococcal nuclease|tara:strand:+ start:7271 stop:7651 length:381 start_codon:yes stop_codon:yes gene_type:complete
MIQPYFYKCKTVRIIDGDTVDADIQLGFNVTLSKTRIRLYNIDTPESRTRNLEEKALGLKAKERLIELLGEKFYIESLGEGKSKGKYGRVLATPFTLDTHQNVCEILVSEGHAAYYDGGKKTKVWA